MAGKGFISIKMFLNDADYRRKILRAQNTTKAFVGKLSGMFAGLAIGAGLTKLATASISAAANLETLTVQFETLTGSAEIANQTMEDLVDFAAKTPFRLEGIAGASKQLLAAGVSTKDLEEELKILGDISAVTGKDLGEMAQIYSKAMNKGKAQTEELNQISEAGIPIMKELGEMYGKTKAEIFKMGERGEITFDVLRTAMANMTSEGGIAEGAMEKLSQTSAGLYSTFKENLNLALASLGEKILPAVNYGLKTMNKLMSEPTKIERLKELNDRRKELLYGISHEIEVMEKYNLTGARANTSRRAIADASKELAKATKEALKIEAELNTEVDKSTFVLDANKKAIDDVTKSYGGLIAKIREGVEDELTFMQEKEADNEAFTKGSKEREEIRKKESEAYQKLLEEEEEKRKSNLEKDLALSMAVNNAKIQGALLLSTQVQGLAGESTALAKAAGIAGATISTYQGAAAALAPPPIGAGPVLGPILAASTVAVGLANVAKIAATPVPSFAIGTTSFSGGLAKLHPNETITNLPQGTKVVSKGMSNNGGRESLAFKIDGDDFIVALERMQDNHNFRRS